jgi:hypothetical protein
MRRSVDVASIRDRLFFLSSFAGQLSMLFIEHKYSAESDQSNEATHKIDVASKILSMLQELVYIAIELSINLHDACCRKIELNNKKYPAAICQVRTIGRVGFAATAIGSNVVC